MHEEGKSTTKDQIFLVYLFHPEFNWVCVSCFSMPHHGRRRSDQRVSTSLMAGSANSNSLIKKGPSPLLFNWGAQYMAETPARVEVVIAIKEAELVGEYKNH